MNLLIVPKILSVYRVTVLDAREYSSKYGEFPNERKLTKIR